MAVRIDIAYEGDLQCTATHGPSGDRLQTDAPIDNQGRGMHFSPTDLVATGAGACMLTVMGIAARRESIDMQGARVSVEKHMSTGIRRFIAKLVIRVQLPASLAPEQRDLLERTGRSCPVLSSLGTDTTIDLLFEYV